MPKKSTKKRSTTKKKPHKKKTTKKRSTPRTTQKTAPTTIKIEQPKEPGVNKMILENFVSLQRVMTNLTIKLDNLSNQISKLLELFEISAKALAEKEFSIEKDSKDVMDKLESLMDQNKVLARGMALMHERIPQEQFPHPTPIPQKQQAPSQKPPTMNTQPQEPILPKEPTLPPSPLKQSLTKEITDPQIPPLPEPPNQQGFSESNFSKAPPKLPGPKKFDSPEE
jgi:hypothetical protein